MDQNFYNSVKIGSLSIMIYLISYVSRNLLSVVTPSLTKSGIYTKAHLGMLASIMFAVYSVGQLINGVLGEKIRSKYMIFMGCLLSGIGMLFFPLLHNEISNYIAFGLLGFGLSMLRGPLMKIISENLLPKFAETVCVLFSAASFAGPLIASVLSVLFDWKVIYYFVSASAIVFAIGSFLLLTIFERKKLITFTPKKENIFKGFNRLFHIEKFSFYLLVGAIAEIVGASITFWIPSYLREYLSLPAEMTAGVFSFMSLVNVFAPLLSIFLYHRIFKNDIKFNTFLFAVATGSFLLLFVLKSFPILNIAFFIIAKVAIGCASNTLWAVFIPSLAKHNVVSTGNGFYDFSGYAFASIFNALFAGSIGKLGWNGLIFIWASIVAVGFVAALLILIKNKSTEKETV